MTSHSLELSTRTRRRPAPIHFDVEGVLTGGTTPKSSGPKSATRPSPYARPFSNRRPFSASSRRGGLAPLSSPRRSPRLAALAALTPASALMPQIFAMQLASPATGMSDKRASSVKRVSASSKNEVVDLPTAGCSPSAPPQASNNVKATEPEVKTGVVMESLVSVQCRTCR